MTKFTRHEVIGRMLDVGIVPIFYQKDLDVAKKIVEACVDGGASIVEFTNRGDFAYQVFLELAKWCSETIPRVALGVGSIIDPGTAAIYINNGASFVVSPILNPEVVRICNRRKIAHLPGCGTVSEISAAEELGVEIVKIFPGGELGGPPFIKNLLGPCPWAQIMPTGGVEPTWESISGWISAGAACLGMGSRLISKDLVAAKNFDGIKRNVEDCIAWVRKARGQPLFIGLEHVGLYPSKTATGAQLADWYAEVFGFKKTEGTSSFFLQGRQGRIEVMKEPTQSECHIAVRVSNFEEACKYLTERGIELEEPKIKKDVKAVYLKKPDKAGNRVHIIYTP